MILLAIFSPFPGSVPRGVVQFRISDAESTGLGFLFAALPLAASMIHILTAVLPRRIIHALLSFGSCSCGINLPLSAF